MTVVKNPFIQDELDVQPAAGHAITVVNKKFHVPMGNEIEISRNGSDLGNVYTHINDRRTRASFIVRDRGEAISKNRQWLNEKIASNDEKVVSALTKIYYASRKGPVNLVCYCAPAPCHGDNIKELIANARIESGKVVFKPLDLNVKVEKVVQEHRTSVKINLRTHMVIKDHFSEVGFKSIPLASYKDYKIKPQEFFVGTEHECNAWIAAPASERNVVESKAQERWEEKMKNNKGSLDVGRSGVQQSMF